MNRGTGQRKNAIHVLRVVKMNECPTIAQSQRRTPEKSDLSRQGQVLVECL